MANKISSEAFKHLRIYKRLSVPLLLNDMTCNRLMKLNYLVDKAPSLYQAGCKFIGKNFINAIVHSTYCKVFSAGASVAEANETAHLFRNQSMNQFRKTSQSSSTTALRATSTTPTWKIPLMKMPGYSQTVQS